MKLILIWGINMKDGNCFGKVLRIIGMVLGGIAIALIFAVIFGYVVMHLWNWLMPDLFGLKAIGYWKALGLVVLAKILFGNFGHHHGKDCKGPMRLKSWKKRKMLGHIHPGFSGSYEEYTEFWDEEGSKAFKEYVEKNKSDGKPS